MITTNNQFLAKTAQDSEIYKKARNKAEEYAQNPEKLRDLIGKASLKANRTQGPLDAVWTPLMACLRLIKSYANGSYRTIPWPSLVMIVTLVIYFVIPIDLIPECLLGPGLIDDATLLSLTFKILSSDIDEFIAWESRNGGDY